MWIADEAAQASKEVPEGWEARAASEVILVCVHVYVANSSLFELSP